MLRHWICISCLWLALLGSSRLQAQARNADDKAAADALFDEARRLLQQRQYAPACEKLEASQKLDPAVGTLLNLADCYEKLGRTASAWATFRDTSALARKAGSAERERIARDRAQALEARLSYLTVIAWKGQEVTIQRDGVALDPAVLGTALPVDPGTHEISAGAPGKRTWSTRVEVRADADRVSVSVPILGDEPAPELPLTATASEPPADANPARTAPLQDAASSGSTQRTLALISAAVGVAGIATGTIFGLKAAANWSDAKAQCPSARYAYPNCPASAVKLSDDAGTAGTVSTVSFIVGGAGVAAAAALWLTAPSAPPETRLSFALAPFAVDLRGRF